MTLRLITTSGGWAPNKGDVVKVLPCPINEEAEELIASANFKDGYEILKEGLSALCLCEGNARCYTRFLIGPTPEVQKWAALHPSLREEEEEGCIE